MEEKKKKGFSQFSSRDASQNKLKKRKRVESSKYWLWIAAAGELEFLLPLS